MAGIGRAVCPCRRQLGAWRDPTQPGRPRSARSFSPRPHPAGTACTAHICCLRDTHALQRLHSAGLAHPETGCKAKPAVAATASQLAGNPPAEQILVTQLHNSLATHLPRGSRGAAPRPGGPQRCAGRSRPPGLCWPIAIQLRCSDLRSLALKPSPVASCQC